MIQILFTARRRSMLEQKTIGSNLPVVSLYGEGFQKRSIEIIME